MCLPANEALKLAAKERAERAAALEEAFLAIKQATGVSTVEEMVEKFLNQGARRGITWRLVVRCCDEAMLGSSGCRGEMAWLASFGHRVFCYGSCGERVNGGVV